MGRNWNLNLAEEREKWRDLVQQEEAWMQEEKDEWRQGNQTEEPDNNRQTDTSQDDECELEDEDGYWYSYGERPDIEIGDEIEGGRVNGMVHAGIVVGIIRDSGGRPVCYKVLTQHEREDGGEQESFFDYIPHTEVSLHEMSGDAEWSLGRIGYRLVEEECGFSYFANEENGDVILW